MSISKNTTIHQLAKRANVSTATASRVINQPESVRPETRSRVLQAMKELNYQAKQNNSRLILATFPTFANPFYGPIIKGMQDAAQKRGFQLLLQQIDTPENPDSYDFLLNSSLFRGIIFTHTLPDSKIIDSLRLKYPFVMCSQHNESDDIPYVIIDDYTATKNAITYLLSIGKKRIAMINSQLHNSYAHYREKAYLDTLKEAGIDPSPKWIAHINGIDFHMAFSAAMNMLTGPEPPDAIFCISDIFASAVIKAAGHLGRSVPDDIVVMGFDNVDLCNMTVPTISSVNQPIYQLGWLSCTMLIDLLEGIPVTTKHIVLDTDIVVRMST